MMGALYAFNYNASGQSSGELGLGTGANGGTVPVTGVQVGTDTSWVEVASTTGLCSLARKADGTIWVAGANSSGGVGFLGLGAGVLEVDTFTQIGSDTDWVAVFAAGSPAMLFGLKASGDLYAWGNNISLDGVSVGFSVPFLWSTGHAGLQRMFQAMNNLFVMEFPAGVYKAFGVIPVLLGGDGVTWNYAPVSITLPWGAVEIAGDGQSTPIVRLGTGEVRISDGAGGYVTVATGVSKMLQSTPVTLAYLDGAGAMYWIDTVSIGGPNTAVLLDAGPFTDGAMHEGGADTIVAGLKSGGGMRQIYGPYPGPYTISDVLGTSAIASMTMVAYSYASQLVALSSPPVTPPFWTNFVGSHEVL